MFTNKLMQFIIQTSYQDLPQEAVTAAKIAILDHIGVAMAGSQEPSGRIINQLVRNQRSPPEATVIGHRYKASCSLAALANGTSAHVLDFDDCLDFPHVGLGHPSTGILPAALALSEKERISGQDMITAYLVGMEAYSKIGLLAKEAFREGRHWEWTGVLGVMGATAAVCKLMRLDEPKINMSLGIASSLACGMTRNFGSMAGHLHAGNASRNGIEASFLANQGFTSHPNIIESPFGYCNTFTGKPEPLSATAQEENARALGNPWNILSPGLMFKAFPCAHISHFGVDAGLQLRKKYSIDWRQIAEIEFRIPTLLSRIVAYTTPQTGVEGKFSLGYCLSRALIEGEIKISHFADEDIGDPRTQELMQKIKWVTLEQKDSPGPFGYQEVILRMKDGNVYSCRVDHPRGEPQNPQTYEEFTAKYMNCAQHAHYDQKTAAQIEDMVLNLEKVKDVSQLTVLFCK